MTTPTVFVAFDGDGIGRRVGRAVLGDNPDELARISQAIERGEEVLKAWAIEHGGRVIEAGGDEATVEVPAAAVGELETVRHKYYTMSGATVSVGVGVRLSQAAKALMASKLRGKDRVTFYDEAVENEVAAAAAQPQTEAEKIAEEYLQKSSTAGRNRPTVEEPLLQDVEHSQGEVARTYGAYKPPAPEMTHSVKEMGVKHRTIEDEFHRMAEQQERADQAHAAKQRDDLGQLRQQVVGALQGIQKQLPVLRQLQQAAPQAYKSVLGLTQAVVALGREISAAEGALAKAEAASPYFAKMAATASGAMGGGAMGMDNFGKDELPGGRADGRRPEDFDPEQLTAGIEHELEHTDDPHIAREIAMDHLAEDPHYYSSDKTLDEADQGSPATKEGGVLDKSGRIYGHQDPRSHHRLKLPVGTYHNGQVKVRHYDNTEGWKSVRAGQAQGQDPSVPLFGHVSHPVSSREPGAK